MADENVKVESRIGPCVQKLDQIARQARAFETRVTIEFDKSKPMPINADRNPTLRVEVGATQRPRPNTLLELCSSNGYCYRGFLGEGMMQVAELCKGGRPFTERGSVLVNSVAVNSKGAPLPGKQLVKLAIEAWCEAFAVPPPDFEEIKKVEDAKKAVEAAKKLAAADVQNQFLQLLRSGPQGVKTWNERIGEHGSVFKKANLEATDLTQVYMYGLDFQSSNFNGATMTKARILNCDLRQSTFREALLEGIELSANTKFTGCDFTGATLAHAKLCGKFTDCNFTGAALTEARLEGTGFGQCNFLDTEFTRTSFWECDLRGTDLSQANLADVEFSRSSYDRETKWPVGFVIPNRGLEWKGRGADPLLLRQVRANAQTGPVNFETFIEHLSNNFDRERLKNSLKMLKAEKFQLFSDVSKESVVGVVKSQTDPDLVYSCRLTSNGQFSCCTQNLFACGGLRGALCKHLLVLLIGLTKANELDPTETFHWVIQSQAQKPDLDKDAASATFFRYRGAESGEIDWRPTETIPEDYYAF